MTIDTIFRNTRLDLRTATAPRFTVMMRSFWKRLAELSERQRSRGALSDMTDDQLRDIGLSRREAILESRRSIWDWNQRF